MTGPEHYQEAEKLLSHAFAIEDRGSPEDLSLLAEAQVHATLALAAATATSGPGTDGKRDSDSEAWNRVAGVRS